MTLSTDWTGAIGSLTFGQGTNYKWRADAFSGLAMPEFRTTDAVRGPQVPGITAGQDVLDGRLLVFPFMINTATATSTQQSFQLLKAAFKPATSETTLDIRTPGLPESEVRFYGRPRGVKGERWEPHGRTVSCIAEFMATDPFFYGAQVTTVSNSGSTITLTNAGDAATRRATFTVTPTASAPTLTNAGDSSRAVTFATTLTSGSATTVTLVDQGVTYGGVARADLVSPSSQWFVLQPGANIVTFTGASAVSCVHRPAYH